MLAAWTSVQTRSPLRTSWPPTSVSEVQMRNRTGETGLKRRHSPMNASSLRLRVASSAVLQIAQQRHQVGAARAILDEDPRHARLDPARVEAQVDDIGESLADRIDTADQQLGKDSANVLVDVARGIGPLALDGHEGSEQVTLSRGTTVFLLHQLIDMRQHLIRRALGRDRQLPRANDVEEDLAEGRLRPGLDSRHRLLVILQWIEPREPIGRYVGQL